MHNSHLYDTQIITKSFKKAHCIISFFKSYIKETEKLIVQKLINIAQQNCAKVNACGSGMVVVVCKM